MTKTSIRWCLLAAITGWVLAPPAELQAQAGSGIIPESPADPINHLPNPYETERDWGTPPAGRSWGSISAVHVDVDGRHLWVGDRCGANSCAGSDLDPIVKLDPDGRVVTTFGAGLIVWPHGMHVDRDGNVWVVDGRLPNSGELEEHPEWADRGSTVLKFSPEGELLLTLGTPGERGEPPTHLFDPTDVVTAPNGDVFVLEGHNSQFFDAPNPNAIGRISKFAADGSFIESWGSWGAGPDELRGPHAVAMDSRGRLFVSDRGNRRIQIYSQGGELLDTWYQFSRVSGLVITDDDVLYAVDSESDPNYNPGWRKGIRVGSVATGEVRFFIPEHVSERPSGMGGFGAMGEGIAVDAEGNMYVGEVGPIQGLTRFVPRLTD